MGHLTPDVTGRLAASGLLPDAWIRRSLRRMIAARVALGRARQECNRGPQEALRERMRAIDLGDEAARALPDELPAEFFATFLGPRMKYSCGLWPSANTTLAESEDGMLGLTCDRARIEDGMDVLDLGCGWGALTFWIAERYQKARVHAVTRSRAQAAFISARAATHGLGNVTVECADVRTFVPGKRFDRVVAIELLEQIKNHEAMFARIASWLAPSGRLFVQAFAHRSFAYDLDADARESWLAGHFFAGGVMPSWGWFDAFDRDMHRTASWILPGQPYVRTLDAWLARLDAARPAAIAALDGSTRQYRRWRVFLMACAELFAREDFAVLHSRFARN